MTYSKDNIVSCIIIILHLVGVVGTAIPVTRELVVSLTPFNLLITFGLLTYCHRGSIAHLIYFILLSTTIGFGVEVLGVTTGWPFGNYAYGETLGFKLFDVPLLIGINWFILAYCFGVISSQLDMHPAMKILVAAGAMVGLDFFIEPIAIRLDYWSWENNIIPASNYIGWLGTALIIQVLFHFLLRKSFNKQSTITVSSQAFYFIILQIFFKF
ncbi:carotenoid biosynthesis protein [Marinoscillum pacificum]|uniref:carotenoid biosynthesis protein n=1 Tax=Marinoscillum pacificum TaxID=392723 RepID=UPI002158336E|nr:carotenoid biosynthesis protein [Marinoscillum pacificum]